MRYLKAKGAYLSRFVIVFLLLMRSPIRNFVSFIKVFCCRKVGAVLSQQTHFSSGLIRGRQQQEFLTVTAFQALCAYFKNSGIKLLRSVIYLVALK